jgi:hypothetical protein
MFTFCWTGQTLFGLVSMLRLVWVTRDAWEFSLDFWTQTADEDGCQEAEDTQSWYQCKFHCLHSCWMWFKLFGTFCFWVKYFKSSKLRFDGSCDAKKDLVAHGLQVWSNTFSSLREQAPVLTLPCSIEIAHWRRFESHWFCRLSGTRKVTDVFSKLKLWRFCHKEMETSTGTRKRSGWMEL